MKKKKKKRRRGSMGCEKRTGCWRAKKKKKMKKRDDTDRCRLPTHPLATVKLESFLISFLKKVPQPTDWSYTHSVHWFFLSSSFNCCHVLFFRNKYSPPPSRSSIFFFLFTTTTTTISPVCCVKCWTVRVRMLHFLPSFLLCRFISFSFYYATMAV